MIFPGSARTRSAIRVFNAIVAGALVFFLTLGCSPGRGVATPASNQADPAESSYRIVRTAVVETVAPAATQSRLRLLASGSANARIVDESRNVLMSAPPEGTIFSIKISPNQDQVLIHYGDAMYRILSTSSLSAIASLPIAPLGHDDATGFGWQWLNDEYLLGNADLPSTDTEGKTAAEIEGTPPRATLLYVYRLEDGTLTPVHIDPTLPEAFMVYETSGWNVTLLSHDDEFVGAKVEQVPNQ